MNKNYLDEFIENAINEDIGDGDHTSLACIPGSIIKKAELLVKENGILAGVEVAVNIISKLDPNSRIDVRINDGASIKVGDIVFIVEADVHAILQAERLVLNVMQRMSGIATVTNAYVKKLEGLKTKIIDTRKTTPGMRFLEKQAVKTGGGDNHRFGLFDMILIKDNHIDFAGGIEKAILSATNYLEKNHRKLKIEIESRSINDVEEILRIGGIDRIMLDNFTVEQTREAMKLINGKVETESSGGITLSNVRDYAECGVDFISIGALTHQIKSLDLSLKALDF